MLPVERNDWRIVVIGGLLLPLNCFSIIAEIVVDVREVEIDEVIGGPWSTHVREVISSCDLTRVKKYTQH